MGHYTRAIEIYNRVISRNPGLAIAYLNRAVAKYKQGRTWDAIQDLDMALRQARSASLRAIIEHVRDAF